MYKCKNSLLHVLIMYTVILTILGVFQVLINVLPYGLALVVVVVSTLLTPLVLLSLLYFFVVYKYKLPFFESLGLKYFDVCSVLSGMLGYMAIMIISSTLITVLENSGYTSPNLDSVPLDIPQFVNLLNIFGALVIAPVLEEFIFRGFIQNILCGKFGDLLGIVLTSLMFGLSHICYSGDLIALSFTVTCGLVLGYIKQKSGNLGTSMCGHFFVNLSACIRSFI